MKRKTEKWQMIWLVKMFACFQQSVYHRWMECMELERRK